MADMVNIRLHELALPCCERVCTSNAETARYRRGAMLTVFTSSRLATTGEVNNNASRKGTKKLSCLCDVWHLGICEVHATSRTLRMYVCILISWRVVMYNHWHFSTLALGATNSQ